MGSQLSPGLFISSCERDSVALGGGREEPVEVLRPVGERAALEVPRQEERRLHLGDDRALEPDHDVVELLVGVVVLDAGAADECRVAVDHHDLAVVEVAEVVEPPVGPPLPEEAVEVEERALVCRHLDAAVDERPVERLGAAVGLAVASLHQQPDRHALGDLADEQVAQLAADHAVLEAEDQDVDVARRGLDVRDQAREERRPVDEDFPGGRGARGEVDRDRQATPALARGPPRPASGPRSAPTGCIVAASSARRRSPRRHASAPPAAAAAPAMSIRLRMPRACPSAPVGWVDDLARVPVPAAATAASGPDGITDAAPSHVGSTSFVRSRARLDSRSQG